MTSSCAQVPLMGNLGGVGAEVNWAVAPLGELIDNIVHTHHAYLRRNLPRLEELMGRLAVVHGLKYCHLEDLARIFVSLRDELYPHMLQEEQVLFPRITQLERAAAEGGAAMELAGEPADDSVTPSIATLREGHQHALESLARINELTRGQPSSGETCRTHRNLLAGLTHLEKDLQIHIYKEEYILYPRAARLEASLCMESQRPLT